jgi:xanthine/CO dehydrogenase XdhC/CoxF family maturation factor
MEVINRSAADLKKAEGKKRKSPSTPLRVKGKGKENSRILGGKRLSCARSRVRRALDERAVERMVESLDWERIWKWQKNRIDATLRRLKPKDRAFARAVLRGKTRLEIGLSKAAFSDRLKKVEKLLRGLKTKGDIDLAGRFCRDISRTHPPFCRLLVRGHVVASA